MFKNLEEVLSYLGNQTQLFMPITEEIQRLGQENERNKKTMQELIILNLGGK